MMVYTLTLNPAVDYDIFFDKVIPGTLNVAQKATLRAAGKGINVSKLLHNLAVPTKALGFLGGSTGEMIRQDLDANGISHHFISVPGTTRVNVKLLTNENETELNGVPLQITQEHVEEIKVLLRQAEAGDYVVFSGSMATGAGDQVYRDLAMSLGEGIKTVLDTRGDLLVKNMHNNYLLKPNIRELEEIAGERLCDTQSIIHAGKALVEKGAASIIISMGGDGAIFVSQQQCFRANAPKGKVVKTMAAGDSMVAAFLYADLLGMCVEDCFRFAVAAGSATAFSETLATLEEINALFKSVELGKVL